MSKTESRRCSLNVPPLPRLHPTRNLTEHMGNGAFQDQKITDLIGRTHMTPRRSRIEGNGSRVASVWKMKVILSVVIKMSQPTHRVLEWEPYDFVLNGKTKHSAILHPSVVRLALVKMGSDGASHSYPKWAKNERAPPHYHSTIVFAGNLKKQINSLAQSANAVAPDFAQSPDVLPDEGVIGAGVDVARINIHCAYNVW
mmetsp:Transcript_26401/g.42804  ORF Transcript_26401/g.42804 Transcript_26401/m.42804 type:complete len:199 (+) Transcript_26401:1398-1994(+)